MDMSLSSLERPFSEPVWADIRSGSRYGIPEESSQKASSARLGSTAQEPQKIKKCDICLGMHDRADCQFLYLVADIKEAKVPKEVPREKSKEECELCRDRHKTLDCPLYAFYNSRRSFSDDESEIRSLVLSESENEESEVDSKMVCDICCGEHTSDFCSYYLDVPQGANVGPFYQIFCGHCDSEMDDSSSCVHCGRFESAYVHPKICSGCGGRKSADCCVD